MKECKEKEIPVENIKYTYKDEVIRRMMYVFPYSHTIFIERCVNAIIEKIKITPSIIDGKKDLSINWKSIYPRDSINKENKSNTKVYHASGVKLSNGEWWKCCRKIEANSLSEAAKIAESDNTFRLHSIRESFAWEENKSYN